jgi:hypothetical protein
MVRDRDVEEVHEVRTHVRFTMCTHTMKCQRHGRVGAYYCMHSIVQCP